MAKKKRGSGRQRAPARAKAKKKSMGKVLAFRRKPRGKPRGTRPGRNGGTLLTGGSNPGSGRPSNEFRERCRLALERIDAIGVAESIAKNKRKAARDRLDALKWLTDRGYGKPSQPVTGEDGGPVEGTFIVEFVHRK